MATDTLTLKFKGIDEVSPATKSIGTSLDGLGKSAGAIAKGALAAVAVGAAAISVELYSAAKAAMEAEENMQRLKKALENSGQATKANLDALVDQSAELQRTTKYSDDAVQSLQALALNLGASAEETKLITLASLDMAAALGTDAESAAKALTLSLSGNSTALGKLIPEVKNMTDEQLAHGAAIELVAKKYRGFAENEGQTFAGTLAKVSNAFGDLQEEIGAIFTDNEGLKDTLAGLVPILDDIKSLVIENKDGLRDMVTYGLTLAVNGFVTLAEGGVVLVDTLFALMEGYKRAAIALDEFNQKITPWETSGISERIAEAKTELAGIVSMRAQFAETGTKIFGIAEAAKELASEAGKSNYVQEQTSIVMDDVTVKTDRYKQRLDAMTSSTKKHNDEVEKQLSFYSELYGSAMYANISKIADELEQVYGARAEDQPGAPSPSGTTPPANDASKWSGIAGAAGSGNVSNMITSAIAIAMPGIGAVIGAAVGPILQMMADGNREAMDDFFTGLGEQMGNIISSIDDLLLSLISSIDEIVAGLAEGIGGLISDLLDTSKGGFWHGLGESFIGVGKDMAEAFGIQVGELFGEIKPTSTEAQRRGVSAMVDQGWISESAAGAIYKDLDKQDEAARQAELEASENAAYFNTNRRAFGGPVTAGESYIVGDGQDGSMRNAEVFTPNKSGTITPKGDGASSGGDLIINITETTNPHHIAQMVSNAVGYLVDTKKWRFDPRRNMAVA